VKASLALPETIEQLVRADPQTGALTLLGSRCRICGEVLFPPLLDCPVCLLPDVMEGSQLAGHGRLRDYVVAERGPEGFDVPYVQAWIELDDGPVVFSIIDTADPRSFDLALGVSVTMVSRQFRLGGSFFLGWKCVVDEGSYCG
jgi:uncharacterized OB-fold protein